MHFTDREIDMLLAAMAGLVARERLARSIRLNYQESVALISQWVVDEARSGESLDYVITNGTKVLTRDQVMNGVPEMLPRLQVEATFSDGVKLVTIDHPIQ